MAGVRIAIEQQMMIFVYTGSVVRVSARSSFIIGLAVRWWDAGDGSGEGAEPPPR